MAILNNGFSILLIVLGFGFLIFVHELGHFLAAKWAGIRAEAFAIGMGPVIVSWRKGIGLRFGSTATEYQRRVNEHLKQTGGRPLKQSNGDDASREVAEMYRVGDQIGLGETEYSLRWLPIGGFVKMLGQEDANPNYVSDATDSYNRAPVFKRMIVVSAGVFMNIVLAIVLFVIAFMVGVKMEAPMVGAVDPDLPAASTAAVGNESLVGLCAGDLVTHIDGDPAVSFADLQIASAMAKPGRALLFTVERPGVPQPLEFLLEPEQDARSGLLSIGVAPGLSNQLAQRDSDGVIEQSLVDAGLIAAGVQPGMRLLSANGVPVVTYETFKQQVDESGGHAVLTTWSAVDESGEPIGDTVSASIPVYPTLQRLIYPERQDGALSFDVGLFGMVPLVEIGSVLPESQNREVLREGDIVLALSDVYAPSRQRFMSLLKDLAGSEASMLVLRDGSEKDVTVTVDASGRLNVTVRSALDVPYIAEPMNRILPDVNRSRGTADAAETPIANLGLLPGSRIVAVEDQPVENWADLRFHLRAITRDAFQKKAAAAVNTTFELPTVNRDRRTVELALAVGNVQDLHALRWESRLPGYVFEPIYITRTAGGNPLKAIGMGFDETRKLVILTYLTIDRLFRGSVGVEQLRGPVGIVHIGTKVVDRGFMYLIFFLGVISVNLAVINFLPLPIVDGGLFLFLVYEKFKGAPPPVAFQNAVTYVGIFLLATIFLVVTYNDIVRLFS